MKKKLVALCAGVTMTMAATVCVGCTYTGIPFIDNYIDDKADDLASYGVSYVKDNADDWASYGKSYFDENADDDASKGKSFVEEKSANLFSEASNLISKLVSGSSDGESSSEDSGSTPGILSSSADINLRNPSGDGKNYVFNYGEAEFTAITWEEHWKIIDSYKIENTTDMVYICQALIDVYPVHGVDMVSYRTADDMAYEWVQHNLAYEYLPEDNTWRNKAKDVDFNPEDQGKTFIDIYEERTGKEFNFSEVFGS